MKIKHKALLFNFLGFALLFVIARLLLGYFFPLHRILLAIIAAVIANVLAPKFAVVKVDRIEKVMMKWIFMKGVREV
ncbi:hypothetical protein HCG49_13940 [Arenibacter sp. 6A1]|uniref:hypothetical protein n=1 Tax=Arenibacter sp. 6A1 TaxID=2720391 RepID=UPI0014457E46|nr:hypothetical protein [Arenibacter sp. 6A1]NKI27666.1 hypothetical protein [Arenibacter sp. 6A1]